MNTILGLNLYIHIFLLSKLKLSCIGPNEFKYNIELLSHSSLIYFLLVILKI